MKYLITLFFVAQLALYIDKAWAQPLNYNDSPLNYKNSELNYNNSPLNYQNSPLNYQNSPLNYNATNGVYDNNGNRVGYETKSSEGTKGNGSGILNDYGRGGGGNPIGIGYTHGNSEFPRATEAMPAASSRLGIGNYSRCIWLSFRSFCNSKTLILEAVPPPHLHLAPQMVQFTTANPPNFY